MRALIVGDVWPRSVRGGDLVSRLALSEDRPIDLFVWTLDAALPGPAVRPRRTILTFDPSSLDAMRLGVQNLVVTASNHVSDTGPDNLVRLLGAIEERGFSHVGAGRDRTEAHKGFVCSVPAGQIAVLAFAETDDWVGAIPARDGRAGVCAYDAPRAWRQSQERRGVRSTCGFTCTGDMSSSVCRNLDNGGPRGDLWMLGRRWLWGRTLTFRSEGNASAMQKCSMDLGTSCFPAFRRSAGTRTGGTGYPEPVWPWRAAC